MPTYQFEKVCPCKGPFPMEEVAVTLDFVRAERTNRKTGRAKMRLTLPPVCRDCNRPWKAVK